MKSLRTQLVLSHILPLLIFIPLLGILLTYIVETQVVLNNVTADLAREAQVLAEIAAQQPGVFGDAAQAEFFARAAGAQYERNVSLYQANGAEVAVIVEQNARAAVPPTKTELSGLLNAETQTRIYPALDPAQATAEVLVPVFSARRQLLGIVRVSEYIDRLSARLTTMRVFLLGSTLLALVAAVGIGAFLAARTARRLDALTQGITTLAQGQTAAPPAEQMPQEFRQAFDAVQNLQTRLRASEDTRKRLLANLVHELGRPLGALQAAIHALQQGADRDDALRQELLQGMDAQVERLKPLLDNLASLHGELDGVVELHRAPVNMSVWLHKFTVTWREAAQQKNLTWQEKIPDALPALNIDADKMAQVLGNLLSNAVKYTPEGGGIELRAGAQKAEVWIAVQDTGSGIAPQDVPHIFDPLYRGSAASFAGTNRFPQGMGLGLSIARDIVNAHGGRIEVASEVGKGSCFTVYLPTS